MKTDNFFNPQWRDDIYNDAARKIPLALPPRSESNDGIWVAKQVIRGESVFGEYHNYKKSRILTAIVKKVKANPFIKITNEDGSVVPEDSPIMEFLNPPKAWMTDSTEELMSMYAVAEKVHGRVLIGGLGMGVLPQMALYLDRPVDSFTIVENSPEIIDITSRAWLNGLDEQTRAKIEIVEQSFEDYIKTTDKKFDSIYLDLWEDSDPRFLPYINLLVEQVKPLCNEGGQIYVWAYALAIDSFANLINYLEREDIDIKKIPARIDPLLTRYGEWRALEENSTLSMAEYEEKARELAMAEKLETLEYDRGRYFTTHAQSTFDRQFIRQILSLSVRDSAVQEPE